MHRRLTNFFALKYLNDNRQNLIDHSQKNKQLDYIQKQNQSHSHHKKHLIIQSPSHKYEPRPSYHRPSMTPTHKLQTETKQKLQNLSYSQKIMYLNCLVRALQKLIKQNGYFEITQPMLQYDLEEPIFNYLIFDYTIKQARAIHPIHHDSKLEQEYEFIRQLKKTLQQIFPTIDLGTNKTFLGFKTHILKLQKTINIRILKKKYTNSDLDDISTSNDHRSYKQIAPFQIDQMSPHQQHWKSTPKIKPRFSLAQSPVYKQLHSFSNTLTKNSSRIISQNDKKTFNMKISQCQNQNDEEKRLSNTTDNLKTPKNTNNINRSLKLQEQLDVLFKSSLSFSDPKLINKSNNNIKRKLQQQLQSLF